MAQSQQTAHPEPAHPQPARGATRDAPVDPFNPPPPTPTQAEADAYKLAAHGEDLTKTRDMKPESGGTYTTR